MKAIVALGSNLENPAAQVQEALKKISEQQDITLEKASSLYATDPVGYTDQPEFINAVALIETTLTPEKLLECLLEIENQFGRVRSFANAPRVLDLDLIDYNHQKMQTEFLVLPHPRAHERGFVMKPLAEIAPDYCLGDLKSAQDILNTLDLSGIREYTA